MQRLAKPTEFRDGSDNVSRQPESPRLGPFLGRSRMMPETTKVAVVYRYAYSLRSLRDVAAEFGISGEYVRLLCGQSGMDVKAQRRRTRELVAGKRLREAAAASPPCAVCGRPAIRRLGSKWTERGNFVTCSHRCAEEWAHGRYHLSDDFRDQHRLTNARSILRNADRRKASDVELSKRMLAHYEATGEVLPPNRSFSEKGRAAIGEGKRRWWAEQKEATA